MKCPYIDCNSEIITCPKCNYNVCIIIKDLTDCPHYITSQNVNHNKKGLLKEKYQWIEQKKS